MRHFKANISNRFLKILFGCQINVAEEITSILPSPSLLKNYFYIILVSICFNCISFNCDKMNTKIIKIIATYSCSTAGT